jgi:hypothetical protein
MRRCLWFLPVRSIIVLPVRAFDCSRRMGRDAIGQFAVNYSILTRGKVLRSYGPGMSQLRRRRRGKISGCSARLFICTDTA